MAITWYLLAPVLFGVVFVIASLVFVNGLALAVQMLIKAFVDLW